MLITLTFALFSMGLVYILSTVQMNSGLFILIHNNYSIIALITYNIRCGVVKETCKIVNLEKVLVE